MKKTLLKRYAQEKDGNIAMMAGIAIATILVGSVAAIDYSLAHNNASESQNVADALSLAAAVKIGKEIEKNRTKKGVKPPTDMYAEGVTYTAEELGFSFQGLAEDTEVEITFKYNMEENEVRTIVTGYSQSNFMNRLGQKSLPFSSESTAEFPSPELQFPASIALVIDNSNSMWSDEDPSAPWDQAHYDHHYNEFRKNQRKNHSTSDELARQVPTGRESRPAGTKQRIASLRTAMTTLNEE
ncbi:MAG: Tad domain-containing protein, partial [Litorimonas sp.]